MITITRSFHFCYGHHLPDHPGKCAGQHGHNAELHVSVGFSGAMDSMPMGMVMDFQDLKKIVNPILEDLDHKNLNDIGFENPTAENIAYWIAEQIRPRLPSQLYLQKVRLSETPDCWVEVF